VKVLGIVLAAQFVLDNRRRDAQAAASSRLDVIDTGLDEETAARVIGELKDLAGGLAMTEQQRRQLPWQERQAAAQRVASLPCSRNFFLAMAFSFGFAAASFW
jgi:hypothetical protein